MALGWTGHNVYLRMPDRCYRFTAVWLNAADVTRHWQCALSALFDQVSLRRLRSGLGSHRESSIQATASTIP